MLTACKLFFCGKVAYCRHCFCEHWFSKTFFNINSDLVSLLFALCMQYEIKCFYRSEVLNKLPVFHI